MEESREQGIKLFGMTIPLRRREEGPMITGHGGGGESDEDLQRIHSRTQDGASPNSPEKSELTSREPQNPHINQDTGLTSKLEDQTPKKPEEILPCPRCNNRDTKFCYFNNYNLNQPRHFCKNCQRYWTAGGSMRNVPVGAGRRKKKCSASHYNQIIQAVQSDHLKPNGTVLNFGSQFESIDCVINLEEKTREEEQMVTHPETGDENLTASSRTTSSVTDEGTGSNMQEPAQLNHQGFFPCFNGSPLPYPWNPAPAFCTTSFPIPFYPAYWGCTVPGDWSFPWLTPLAPSPNSITLGKHSREGEVLAHLNLEQDGLEQEGRLWIPKTMRIDGPDEAATSSLWATMGFKKDKADSLPANSRFLNANPAALSRSLNFQESA